MIHLAVALGAIFTCAQPEVEDPKARAQELIARGNEFYAKKEYQAALALFERAHAVFPSPIIFYNIAKAHRILGNLLRAAEYYEKFLAESDVKQGSERYELANADLRELDGRLGHLTITGAPPGAKTQLDGKEVAASAVPIRVLPGEHEVRATLEGHEEFRSKQAIEAGASAKVEIAMVRALPKAPARKEPVITVPTPVVETKNESILSSWWFWTLVVGGAAIAAGATIAVASGGEFRQTGELERSSTDQWESF